MKKTLISTLAVGLITTSILGAGGASAQSPTPPTGDQKPVYSSLIDKIASSFGLDKTKVQTVVDQWHSDHKQDMLQNMQKRLDERLSQAVKDGKITEAQKTAIKSKLEEKNSVNKEALKNMPPQERRDAMDKKRTDLEAWAKSQEIDPNLLKDFGMGRRGGGFGHKMNK